MPLTMNREVFITCAVTGSGDTTGKSDQVPVTPAQIAESAIDAAKAGAAIVHCHVRDPETGQPSRDPALFREVTERIRESETDVVLNLTAGMGGDRARQDAPEQHHDLADPEFGDAARVRERRVEDGHAPGARRLEVDLIGPDAEAADGGEIGQGVEQRGGDVRAGADAEDGDVG